MIFYGKYRKDYHNLSETDFSLKGLSLGGNPVGIGITNTISKMDGTAIPCIITCRIYNSTILKIHKNKEVCVKMKY